MKDISAFPEIKTEYNESIHEYTNNTYSTGGMSLRDYFAAKAMQGICADPTVAPPTPDIVATIAYQVADAMLKARGE